MVTPLMVGKPFLFGGRNWFDAVLDEVMEGFPNQSLLIHIKSNDPNEGVQLAAYLSKLPKYRLNKITVYGGDEPVETLHQRLPDLRVMSKATIKACLIPYI